MNRVRGGAVVPPRSWDEVTKAQKDLKTAKTSAAVAWDEAKQLREKLEFEGKALEEKIKGLEEQLSFSKYMVRKVSRESPFAREDGYVCLLDEADY